MKFKTYGLMILAEIAFLCWVHDRVDAVTTASQGIQTPTQKSGGTLGHNQERLERLEKQLDELRTLLKIPGMSAVMIRDQKVLWAKGFGFADLEKRISATPDTPYRIASLTKTFAAILVMQLVEQGKLDPNEPISKYSSDFKDDTVKIKHLLSHTSEGTPGERYQYNWRSHFGNAGTLCAIASESSF